MTFACTVSSGNTLIVWNVLDIPLLAMIWGMRLLILLCRKKTSPDVGVYIPLNKFSRVVFPEPFGPMSETMDPGYTLISTESTAVSPPKALVIFIAWSSGVLSTSRFLGFHLLCRAFLTASRKTVPLKGWMSDTKPLGMKIIRRTTPNPYTAM